MASSAPIEQPPSIASDEQRPHEVLLVDDDLLILQELWETTHDEGLNVYIANDPREAIERVLSRPHIDTIVTDLTMPVLNGLELIRTIRKRCDPERPFRFIILTGNATVDAGIEAIRLGVSEFLTKPCDGEPLLAAIDRAFTSLDEERRERRSIRRIIDEKNLAERQIWKAMGLHQEAIEHEHDTRHQIINMLADEIRGPISTIIMLAEAMDPAQQAEGPDYSRMIGDKGKEVLRKFDLVSALGNKLNSQQAPASGFDVRELLLEQGRRHRERLPGKTIRLIGDASTKPLPALANREAVDQVFSLLFGYIIDHQHPDDRVWLASELEGGRIRVRILISRTESPSFRIEDLEAQQEPTSPYQLQVVEQIEIASARILMRLYGGEITSREVAQIGRLLTVTIPSQNGLALVRP